MVDMELKHAIALATMAKEATKLEELEAAEEIFEGFVAEIQIMMDDFPDNENE